MIQRAKNQRFQLDPDPHPWFHVRKCKNKYVKNKEEKNTAFINIRVQKIQLSGMIPGKYFDHSFGFYFVQSVWM